MPPFLLTLLQTVVHSNKELCNVKNTGDQLAFKANTVLTYGEYRGLLQTAALNYDQQFQPKEAHHLKVYKHHLSTLFNDEETDDVGDVDIEQLVLNINAHNHESKMVWQKWKALSDSAKKVWDQLDNASKKIL